MNDPRPSPDMIDLEPLAYARQLYTENYGYPLYSPEPTSSTPFSLSYGVLIGDVGRVTIDGAFEILFNVRFDASHPRNQIHGVPRDFQPLNIPEVSIIIQPGFHRRDCDIARGVAISRSAEGTASASGTSRASLEANESPTISGERKEGAFLHLPDGATRFSCPPNLFRDYAITHAQSWYQFAQEQQFDDNISLFLVTGCDKTSSWAIGAYYNATSQLGVELEITQTQLAGGNVQYGYHSKSLQQYLPSDLPTPQIQHEGSPSEAHCIFFRGFKVDIRRDPPRKRIRVKLELDPLLSIPQSLEPDHSTSSSSKLEDETGDAVSDSVSEPSELPRTPASPSALPNLPLIEGWHPAKQWNEFLFSKCPEARVVLTHDDDVSDLQQIAHIGSAIDQCIVEKNGGAYLNLSAVVKPPWERQLAETIPSVGQLPEDPSHLRSTLDGIARTVVGRELPVPHQHFVLLALQYRMADIIAFGETPTLSEKGTSPRTREIAKQKRKRDTKLFVCFLCGTDITSKQNLSKHILSHYKMKTVQCEICGARLAGDIARHQRSCPGRRRDQ